MKVTVLVESSGYLYFLNIICKDIFSEKTQRLKIFFKTLLLFW